MHSGEADVEGQKVEAEADNFHGLKDLYMEDINVTENIIHCLFFNSPLLERFYLLFSSELDKLIVYAPNLKFMRLYSLDNLQHLEISSAQNLNTIEIGAAFALQRVNISTPNLSHLIISIDGWHFKFDSYLSLLNQVKRLTLLIEACPEEILDTFPFPQFSKVEHLELEMVLGSTIPIHHLPNVLIAAPFLNIFTFEFYKTGHPGACNGLKWLDEYILEKVKVNGHLCQYVKIERGYWYNHEDEFDNQYEKLCVGCAQQLKTKILQVHPHANVILTV
ncbi:hypothetical protein FEM48_Zijuj06G0085300 [Ziziphus jujuba var. spinosa]|uniref:At1g61320/AtMIF1 LRR domain-containing protein n=1 Tax=Ziziphus jujuba var. spinosa TaxID=714518 RepID=A0A978V885_ZIZJJ|nr:hypothetical protein FEM48_Zijuj06G0085300 [Ziziphus jujuba var. spinosa]